MQTEQGVLGRALVLFVTVKSQCWFFFCLRGKIKSQHNNLSKSFLKSSRLDSAISLLSAAIPRFTTTSSTTYYLLMSAWKIRQKMWYKHGWQIKKITTAPWGHFTVSRNLKFPSVGLINELVWHVQTASVWGPSLWGPPELLLLMHIWRAPVLSHYWLMR